MSADALWSVSYFLICIHTLLEVRCVFRMHKPYLLIFHKFVNFLSTHLTKKTRPMRNKHNCSLFICPKNADFLQNNCIFVLYFFQFMCYIICVPRVPKLYLSSEQPYRFRNISRQENTAGNHRRLHTWKLTASKNWASSTPLLFTAISLWLS